MHVIGYVRVSTEEQGMSGAGLQAQRAAIIAECQRRGWTLVEIAADVGRSGKDLKRPGVRAALDRLAAGDASALVVAKLDRPGHSVPAPFSLREHQPDAHLLQRLRHPGDLRPSLGQLRIRAAGTNPRPR